MPRVSLRELDLQSLDREALAATGKVIQAVRPEHLDLPTPCTEWTVRELLRHLISENRGFAANAAGFPTDRSVWDSGRLGDDPYGAYQDSAALVSAAFSAHDIDERKVEVREFGVFPGRVAISLHFVDFLVHGWDVARAAGIDADLDERLCEIALAIALRWPEDRPGVAFDVQVAVPPSASAGDRLLGYLGRSPSWRS